MRPAGNDKGTVKFKVDFKQKHSGTLFFFHVLNADEQGAGPERRFCENPDFSILFLFLFSCHSEIRRVMS